jgi:hypothetical protein
VREVCETAAQEYKIESALDVIDAKWKVLELVMDEHKKGFPKVKKVDEVGSFHFFLFLSSSFLVDGFFFFLILYNPSIEICFISFLIGRNGY